MKKRQLRLADQMRDLIANCIMHEVSDPRVQGVVVTFLRLSGDFLQATVYFRFYNDKFEKDDVMRGLESCRGLFRKTIGDNLDLRRIPELSFRYDESIEHGANIEKLISKTKS